jgi:CMP-N,N'-diacetyllegionaminic acid synthase
VPGLRPAEMAAATSPDIEWVAHVLDSLMAEGERYEVFSILRPTSPFRSPASIAAAVQLLRDAGASADSVRAVRPVKEHPGKMWLADGAWLRPLLPQPEDEVPLHSRQFHALPPVLVQDSSLEVAWTRVVAEGGGISGTRILAWHNRGYEGLSIDYPEDFDLAERLVASGEAQLPGVAAG